MDSYKIPEEILSKIPGYFWPAFAGELCSVFGPDILGKDEDDIYAIDYAGGTAGWHAALKATTHKLSMAWLFDYYDGLEWYDSDQFDGELEDLVRTQFIEVKQPAANPYYLWLLEQQTEERECTI